MSEEEREVDQSVEEFDENDSPEAVLGADAFDDEPTDTKESATEESELVAETPPTETDEAVIETPDESEKPEDTAETGIPDETSSVPELVDFVVKHQGSEFAVKVTPEQAKVLDAQYKTALQLPHLQERYNQANAQLERASEVAHRPAPTDPGGSAEFDPDAFFKQMEPVVKDAVERGAMSEYFAETFPDVAAHMAYGHLELEALKNELAPIRQERQQEKLRAMQSQLKSEVQEYMSAIAGEQPEIYGDLSNQEKRDQFFNHLCEYNVDIKLLATKPRETLRAMFAAWQGPGALEAARAAAAEAERVAEEKRRLASVGGGGGGTNRTTAPSGLEDILDTFKM
jgi:hypothetical protein